MSQGSEHDTGQIPQRVGFNRDLYANVTKRVWVTQNTVNLRVLWMDICFIYLTFLFRYDFCGCQLRNPPKYHHLSTMNSCSKTKIELGLRGDNCETLWGFFGHCYQERDHPNPTYIQN